jgi:hypothetical protein
MSNRNIKVGEVPERFSRFRVNGCWKCRNCTWLVCQICTYLFRARHIKYKMTPFLVTTLLGACLRKYIIYINENVILNPQVHVSELIFKVSVNIT